jgi:hypothetical protein
VPLATLRKEKPTVNTRHLYRSFYLLAALLCLSVAAPRAHAASLLFWDFENTSSAGSISTAVGTPGVSGITGFASQTGGGPAEYFGAGPGVVHLTRYFGTYHPYIEFTLTRPMLLTNVTFDHQHNHNFGFPTYPGYATQLQINTGSGYQDIGSPLALFGLFSVDPYDGTQSGYVTGSSIPLNVVVAPGTYRIRWDARNLAYGTDTNTEYFALNNVRLNGTLAPFAWSGFLQPINADGTSVFKAGSTVPAKFQLTGAWAGITDLVATLSFRKVSSGVPGDVNEATSTSAATTGSQFRYDASSGQYIFNWSTKGLEAGIYRLEVYVGTTVVGTVDVGLK